MFDDKILDEDFLRELMLEELELDLNVIEIADELQTDAGLYLVRSFSNIHEAKLYDYILRRIGIPTFLDETMSSADKLDPLTNSGTYFISVEEKNIKSSVSAINALDRHIRKDQKEKERNIQETSRPVINLIVLVVIILLSLLFVMKDCLGS